MCSHYPGIKLEPALGTLEDKIEHLSSYAHVVHTTAKQVISRRGKNENVYKMSKNEKCTCKACKNTVFYCQLCKFVRFLLPSSSWLLKLPIFFTDDAAKQFFPTSKISAQEIRHQFFPYLVKLNDNGSYHGLREPIRKLENHYPALKIY